MPVWSLIKMFFTFVRELLFDSKEEFDYSSSKFNARKMVLFLLFAVITIAAVLMAMRLVKQSVYVVKLKDAVVKHEIDYRESDKRKTEEINRLREYIDNLPDKVKKSNPVPSDSRNDYKKDLPEPEQEIKDLIAPKIKPKDIAPEQPVLDKEERKKLLEGYIHIH